MAKILAIDDKEDNLISLVAVMKSLMPEHRVITASSGKEGLQKAADELPDTVLLDIIMPEMDGFEVCRRLKSEEKTKHIPVIMLTAIRTDHKSRIKGLEIGADAFLTKPIDEAELVAQIRAMLRIRTAEAVLRREKDVLEEIVKQRTKALRESETYFRSLLHSMREDILVIDTHYRIVDVNNSFLVTAGLKREEAIGQFCFQVSHGWNEPCGSKGDICMLREVFETGKPEKCRHQHIGPGNSPIWVDILLSPLFDEKGGVTHVIESVRDITDLVKTERALKESEERYRDLFENAPNAYFSVSAPNGNILRCNAAAARLLGYEKRALSSMSMFDLYADTPHGRPKAEELFKRFQAGESINDMELQMKHKGGYAVWVSLTVEPVKNQNGKVVENKSVVIDISDRIRLEAQLRQAQKMEAIGTLAGGIAHDFNNILMPMMVRTEMAMMDIPDDIPARHHLEEVLVAGERAKDMVKQILSFSRQDEQDRSPLRISHIVKEALKLLRASMPSFIEIRQDIWAESGFVLSNPAQIQQVLMNLCANASHAMREGTGVLGVELVDVYIDPETSEHIHNLRPGPYVKLTVSDTGHGIDPKVMERIFEPYFTTKGKNEGTGMGLAMVHGIVKSHGGTILVDSNPCQGSAFHVFLPKIDDPPLIEKQAPSQLPEGTERILLVDDDRAVIEAVKPMLERLGYRVIATTNSLEALNIFEAEPDGVDLIITDQTMPSMTGGELAKAIIGIRRDIPIILCTGFSEIMKEAQAKAMGIREFVMKPIAISEMATMIRKALDPQRTEGSR